jgi:hypothetical protein
MSSPANKPEWYTIATTSGCIELMACSVAQALLDSPVTMVHN